MHRRRRRILGYARVSSEEQARGTSLQAQQNGIRAYAATLGVAIAHLYVEAESAVSEKFERRAQIQMLMADLRPGDLVVCHTLDRWSRDPEFSYSSIRRIRELGASFYALADNCDPSTSDGDTMLAIRILMAREEHKRIKERTVGARHRLRDRGFYPEGPPPFGYRRLDPGRRHVETNGLIPDPTAARVVRRIFRLCVSGKPFSQIAELVGLSKSSVRAVLHRRIYLGLVHDSRGQWIRGQHAPILDADLFLRAHEALHHRRRSAPVAWHGHAPETSTWFLRDIAICGHCGAKMRSAYGGPRGARRYYFGCVRRCIHRLVRVRNAEDSVASMVLLQFQSLREELGRPPIPETSPHVIRFATQVAKIDARRARVIDAFTDGFISSDEMRARMDKLDDTKLQLQAQQVALARPNPLTDRRLRRRLLRSIVSLEQAWLRAAPLEKRALIGILASAVRLDPDAPPEPVWRTAAELAEHDSLDPRNIPPRPRTGAKPRAKVNRPGHP